MPEVQHENHDPKIRVRGRDGVWRDLEATRKASGDAEIEALWSMNFSEFQTILDDSDHPLHAKASAVARELAEPLASMAKDVLKPLVDAMPKFDLRNFVPKLDFASLAPVIDLSPILAAYNASSWISRVSTDFPKLDASSATMNTFRVNISSKAASPQAEIVAPFIDYDSIEPPEMSVNAIAQATEVRMVELRATLVEYFPAMVAHLAALVDEAKSSSETDTKTLRWARVSGWAAIAAAVIALAGIAVTTLVS